MLFSIERQKEHFKNHVATFTDYGNIKILDFKEPGTSEYRIRFLFEEDYHKIHISGDLGELIATNHNNMCYEGFSDFVHNTEYFREKIDCHSRELYEYDYDKCKKELEKLFESFDFTPHKFIFETEEEIREKKLDEILDDFDQDHGIAKVSGNSDVQDFAEINENAHVYGDSLVFDNAWICGDARVHGNVCICGNADISGAAEVYGGVTVKADSWISGNAEVYEDNHVISVTGIFKNGYTITFFRDFHGGILAMAGGSCMNLESFDTYIASRYPELDDSGVLSALVNLAERRIKKS